MLSKCQRQKIKKIKTLRAEKQFLFRHLPFREMASTPFLKRIQPKNTDLLVTILRAGNTKGGSITVWLTSCLTILESAV